MKKLLMFAAIFVSLVILIVGIYLVISLASIDSAEPSPVVTTQVRSAVIDYAKENYPEFSAQYDAEKKLLRLSKATDFSFQSAASIYEDTSTYLTQAQIFALDISAVCGEPELIVELCYLSKEQEPMLSVASNGTLTKYWE